jgi:hypothetical protein
MNRGELIDSLSPNNAAVITSYKCNARCRECCFECGPSKNFNTNLNDYKTFIDSVVLYESVKFIVWTGGEATLLKDTLLNAISYAKSKGLYSRLVTNGSWANNYLRADNYIKKLIACGVVEVSFSTGDNHLEFIPIDKVMYGVLACIENGVRCVVSIESTKHSKFTQEDLYQHELYKKIASHSNRELFNAVSSTWVSFHTDTIYEYNDLNPLEVQDGCNNLFEFIGLNPDNKIISCCGLTNKYITDMQLGSQKNTNLHDAYNKQKTDFMKRWLYVDGPLNILTQVIKWNPQISPPQFRHHCQTCAYIYNNPDVRKTIVQNYTQIVDEVNKKFYDKINLKNYLYR